MLRIDQLSGDSSVMDVQFIDGHATCHIIDGETDDPFFLSIPTDRLLSQQSHEYGTVHVRLITLTEKLPIDPLSKRYMLPAGFVEQMVAAREGWQLAVGLHADEWPLFLQLRGTAIVLACPLRSMHHVTLEPVVG